MASTFIEVSYNAAHWPWQRPDEPSRARDNGRMLQPIDEDTATRDDYVAVLERADQGVGRILETLDRLDRRENTLVIFTNDNGGEWLSRNAPLFHRKKTVWEGGIRVPAIFRWPGRIPAGQISSQVGIVIDLTASILAPTNSPVPADARLEGLNLLPILEGRSPAVERTLFFRVNAFGHQQRVVRQGEWKLMLAGRTRCSSTSPGTSGSARIWRSAVPLWRAGCGPCSPRGKPRSTRRLRRRGSHRPAGGDAARGAAAAPPVRRPGAGARRPDLR